MVVIGTVCVFVYSFIYRAVVMSRAAFVCRCGKALMMNARAGYDEQENGGMC
jgi:hypothetical protein